MAVIKLLGIDVDGVLTDGSFWWDSEGLELKKFCFSDRTGIPLAQKAGIVVAIVSGDSSENGMKIVDRYAKRFNIEIVYKGCHDKAAAIREIATENRIDLSEICFVGDDIADIPALEIVGLSAAPNDAQPSVLKIVDYIAKREGGRGAVREIIDAILDGSLPNKRKEIGSYNENKAF